MSDDTEADVLSAHPPVRDGHDVQMANAMGVSWHATVEVEVAGNDTPQRWTGATWNDHMARAERAGEDLNAQVIHVYPAWESAQQRDDADGWAR